MSGRLSELPGGLRVVSDTMDTVETVSLGAWIVATISRHSAMSLSDAARPRLSTIRLPSPSSSSKRGTSYTVETVGMAMTPRRATSQ